MNGFGVQQKRGRWPGRIATVIFVVAGIAVALDAAKLIVISLLVVGIGLCLLPSGGES
jgi:hypothetical protein